MSQFVSGRTSVAGRGGKNPINIHHRDTRSLVSPHLAGCAGAAVSLTLAAPDRLTTIDTLYFRSAETASAGTRVRDLKSAALTLSVFL